MIYLNDFRCVATYWPGDYQRFSVKRFNLKRILSAFFVFFSMFVNAENIKVFKSKESQATLLELYTSQGCSSCPRAEKWINQFVDHKKLWNDFFPVNFHVDYWDYLGWKDPFAFSAFSDRQRLLKANGNTRVVATPGFIVNGRGWSGWFIRQPVPFKKTPLPIGVLEVSVKEDKAEISFSSLDPSLTEIKATLVVLGFNQETSVPRGENSGRKLSHQFVALGVNHKSLNIEGALFKGSVNLPSTEQFDSPKKAVVVWIESKGQLTPLQVTGGWL